MAEGATLSGIGGAVDSGARRIVHFVHALNGRTIAQVAAALAEDMSGRGYEVTLVAVHETEEAAPPMPTVPTVVLGHPTGRRTTGSLATLRRALRRLAPDVVFAHGNGPARAAILATRGWRGAPRVVGIEHNHYSSYAWDHRRARDLLNAVLLPRADAIIGVSDGVVEDLAATFPRLRDRLALVPSPLTRYRDIQQLASETVDHPWFDDGAIPVVTTVGHVHPRKDHRTLVRAMARVRDVLGPSAARLVIIGAADGEEAAHVRALISELGLSDQVDLVGAQANPLKFVARSTVFALSSRNEGMGIAILEAMAVGVPVVSTDCPSGPAWLLDGGAGGLLAPVGDGEALGDALVAVLGDQALRRRLGRWGRERAQGFSPAVISSRYLATASLRPRLDEQPVTAGS
jgi:glycosyltransferase involved in cell wall biosynthesis